MTIANVTTTHTFDEWRTVTNQLIGQSEQAFTVAVASFGAANTIYSAGANAAANLILANSSYMNTIVNNVVVSGNVANIVSGNTIIINTIYTNANSIANSFFANTTMIFAQANTARDVANQSFAKANTANITADLAYSKANTANADVGAAFLLANIAFAQANTANSDVGAAFLLANQIFSYANTTNVAMMASFLTANLAFSKANTANSDVGAALLRANTAWLQANVGLFTAQTAFAKANTSVQTGISSTITVGYKVTPYSLGTGSGTVTANAMLGNYQYITNNGAFTLAAPGSDCAIDILVTNGASASTLTLSGFTVGSATGSALTTTSGNKFLISVRRINSVSTYTIYALQ